MEIQRAENLIYMYMTQTTFSENGCNRIFCTELIQIENNGRKLSNKKAGNQRKQYHEQQSKMDCPEIQAQLKNTGMLFHDNVSPSDIVLVSQN